MKPARRPAMTLLELLVAIAIIATLVGLLLPTVMRARDYSARASCASNLKQLALALHQFHDAANTLPPGFTLLRDDGFVFLGWEARLLPYIEQEGLWRITAE